MLPAGHLEFTWAALNLVQRRTGLFRGADYRLVALAALAPDLLDKPLALTVYRETQAALFWGHNLWLHGAVWLAVWGATSGQAGLRRRAPGEPAPGNRFGEVAPYLLAFSGHLLADRMWGFRDSLFYPLGAGHWHRWRHVGGPAAMLGAYLGVIRTAPILVVFEGLGAGLLVWFVADRRLWEPKRLGHLLRTGRPCDARCPAYIPLDGSKSRQPWRSGPAPAGMSLPRQALRRWLRFPTAEKRTAKPPLGVRLAASFRLVGRALAGRLVH